jgi:hypothetical protein
VLHLAATTIIAEESAQSAQSAQDTQEPTDPNHSTTGNGSIPWADYASTGQESTQEIDPFPAERGGNGSIGPIGTVIPA